MVDASSATRRTRGCEPARGDLAGQRGGQFVLRLARRSTRTLPIEPPQLGDDRRERTALDVPHRVVVDAPLAAHRVDRHDVRVVQLRRGLRLVLEPLERLLAEDGANGKTLSATWRPSVSWIASYTTPIPPRPISRRMRKSPSSPIVTAAVGL